MQAGLRTWVLLLAVLVFAPLLSPAAETNELKPAKIKISGYGILGNRGLKRTLTTLELGGKKRPFLGASFVEDAALILASRLKRDGYQRPSIHISMQLEDGSRLQTDADDLLENPLPRPLRIKEVHFKIRKGPLFYYDHVAIEGLETMAEKQALTYFMETGTLLNLKRMRIYTPEGLDRSLSNLADVLDRQGYQDAKAEVVRLSRNDKIGAVDVRIRVRQGRKYIVRSVREDWYFEGSTQPDQTRTVFPNRPYSRLWLQDFTLSLKTNQFRRGFPDVAVQVDTLHQKTNDNTTLLDLQAKVKSGPRVRIHDVEFVGEKKTRPSRMARSVRVKRGELLNPIRTEQGRFNLARLGIFDTVDTDYHPVSEHERDVIYRVKEGKTLDLSLLFGWGSYELLRGGFVADANNIWGLAHHAQLKAVQSFKATSGEFTYTVPDFRGKDVDLFLQASGLRREEISFTREEYGGGIGAHKFFKRIGTDATLRYNYQILNALSIVPAVASEGLTNPAVGSFTADIKFDRRDNPLYPRKGYKLFGTFETASESLGGEANYQRIDASGSWHFSLGGGRWLGLGLNHGIAASFGDPAENLPFNRRFFPGGAASIRGYQEGEASPRNAQGQIVGAESYMLGTVELEQALTPKWSLVFFSDNLGFARRMANYPFDTGLFSVGGGIRWRTIVGPIRLEYGHNLNPRPKDPAGTIQFTLGFPF